MSESADNKTLIALAGAMKGMGGDEAVLRDPSVAHLAIEGSRVLSGNEVPGLSVKAVPHGEVMDIDVLLERDTHLAHPVHMCFGVMSETGVQRLLINVKLEPGAQADFIAHCMFPTGRKVLHAMDARVELAEGARMSYREAHYHGPYGGVTVDAKAHVVLGEDASYLADFSLLDGLVGRLALDYSVEAGPRSVVELTARVFGHKHDEININESAVLAGEGARSVIKTRIAIEDDARAEVRGITEGRAAHARGHVDCTEIVRGRAQASAIPQVSVTHPLAKVTHEAAIGSVDKGQMQTLCARGLTPDEAVDVIVKGLLR